MRASATWSGGTRRIGEILIERGDITPEELAKVLGQKKLLGELLVESGIVQPGKIESALGEQKFIRELQEKKRGAEGSSYQGRAGES